MLTARPTPETPESASSDPSSHYRSLGWWVEHDLTTGVTELVLGGAVSVLTMPASLAVRVHRVLSIHLLAGPVIAYPDEWALFADAAGWRELPTDLTDRHVAWGRTGRRLPLPAPHVELGETRWVNHPRANRPHPHWQTVVSATRRATAQGMSISA